MDNIFDESKIDYLQPSVTEVLKFLHSLKSKGFNYSIINSASCALSAFITLEGLEAGKHPLICQYMKGLYDINPSLPKYSSTWDVGTVVKHLSGIPKNLKQRLSGKLATLLAILCGQRAREILAVMDLRNICFEKDVVIICIGNLLKTSTQKFHLGEIKFPSYHDKTICPMEVLNCYTDLTKDIRVDLTGLFITTTKPYSKASKDTLSRWVEGMMKGAGIDIKIFSPHSNRSASTSMTKSVHLPIDLILKTEGWRSM